MPRFEHSIFSWKIYMCLIFLIFFFLIQSRIRKLGRFHQMQGATLEKNSFLFFNDVYIGTKIYFALLFILLYSISIQCIQVQYYIQIQDVEYPLRYDLNIKKGIIKIWLYVRPLFIYYTCIHADRRVLTHVSLNVYRFSIVYTSACQITISMY